MPRDNLLIVADSERDADMLFAVGMLVPDPFIYLRLRGRPHIVIEDTDVDRARRQARHCRVLALSSFAEKLRKRGERRPGPARIVAALLRSHRIRKVLVPSTFPHGLARELRTLRIKVKVPAEPIFPEREAKTPKQVEKINAALMMAEVGLAEALQVLKASKVAKDGRLMYHQLPLTAERLRSVIEVAVLQAGGIASRTIVAGGVKGCDPQERGHGPLRANQTIVLNVRPRSQKTGYCAEIARTVVKGCASEAVRKLFHTVLGAQEMALAGMSDGKPARDIHHSMQQHFEANGYSGGRHRGRTQGFLPSSGHGLGLELQEAPRISAASQDILRAGHIVTLDSALYYPSIGAVRLEDVALVTTKNARNLTKFEKTLEL